MGLSRGGAAISGAGAGGECDPLAFGLAERDLCIRIHITIFIADTLP